MVQKADNMRYLKIIRLYFLNSLQTIMADPLAFWFFFISKSIRYGLFFAFLYYLSSSLVSIGGYSAAQMMIFYLVFNLIDTTAQMLYRETYRFRPLVITGGFDGVLAKPFPPLIRVLIGGPDFIDMGILAILVLAFAYVTIFVIQPDITQILTFLLLFTNSLIIATSFHVFVLGVGILTLSVDHLIMIYRDLTALMRLPVDFFSDSLRALFTFVIPLGVMFTFPAKALFGILSLGNMIISFVLGLIFLYLSLRFWKYSLKHYQSASS